MFKIVLRLRDQHVLKWQSVEILNLFSKTKSFFKKLEYSFLVESTKVENASFPYKTVISEANVKTK